LVIAVLLSRSSDGKPEADTAVLLAPDDGYDDAPKHVDLYLNDK